MTLDLPPEPSATTCSEPPASGAPAAALASGAASVGVATPAGGGFAVGLVSGGSASSMPGSFSSGRGAFAAASSLLQPEAARKRQGMKAAQCTQRMGFMSQPPQSSGNGS